MAAMPSAEVRALPDPPARRPNRMVLIAGAVAVILAVLLVVAGLWWVNTSTVPKSDYEAATIELETAIDQNASLEAEIASLSQSLAEAEVSGDDLRATLTESADEISILQDSLVLADDRLERFHSLAAAFAGDTVNFWEEDAQFFIDNGADVFLAEELLEEMQETPDFLAWSAGTRSWYTVNSLVADIDDAALDEYWLKFSESTNDDENWMAIYEWRWRLAQLMLEMDGEADGGSA